MPPFIFSLQYFSLSDIILCLLIHLFFSPSIGAGSASPFHSQCLEHIYSVMADQTLKSFGLGQEMFT